MSQTRVNSIGPRLAQFREEAGLSVQAIINRTGFSRSGIEKMEQPDSNPTVKTLELYLRACGKTLGELFCTERRKAG